MIRYSLICKKKHGFEGWFRDSNDFDRQCKGKLVTCPECGTSKVEKALMAPNVRPSGGKRRRAEVPATQEEERVPAPAPSLRNEGPVPQNREQVLLAMRAFRRKVEESSEYVGPRFADEARKIHHSEAEERRIYGEASLKDARELIDEGINLLPLPRLPEDEN